MHVFPLAFYFFIFPTYDYLLPYSGCYPFYLFFFCHIFFILNFLTHISHFLFFLIFFMIIILFSPRSTPPILPNLFITPQGSPPGWCKILFSTYSKLHRKRSKWERRFLFPRLKGIISKIILWWLRPFILFYLLFTGCNCWLLFKLILTSSCCCTFIECIIYATTLCVCVFFYALGL